MPKGKVFLVGAGPGDEELLTVKACRLIENAKLVVFDRLISDEIMAKIPNDAVKINVGKNVGNHPVPQEEINRILVDNALLGHDVVRLKGGDSFLFGRGGEELEGLVENGIDFEVIPGITSPLAASAYAGIPVTHRDFCSSLHIITGHKKKDLPLELDYAALVRLNGTLVFMMSVANISEIAEGLITGGMEKSMPCAIVENGTRSNQRKFTGTLANIEQLSQANNVVSPSIFIVGRVCELSDKFDWFSKLPLFGKRILVTRPAEKIGRLSLELKKLGADITHIPAVKTIRLPFILHETERGMAIYSALAFTSSVAVSSFFEGLYEDKKDARFLKGKLVLAVGKETAKALLSFGIVADFIPTVYSGAALATQAIESGIISKADRLLLIKPKEASPDMPQILKENAIAFDELTVYETIQESGISINPSEFDIITFTSASCVNAVAECCDKQQLAGITAVCIGEQTAKAAKKYNMNIVISDEATIDSMLNKIIELT